MNIATALITIGISLVMLYTGLLFSWTCIRSELSPQNLRAFAGLAMVNYLLIPFATYLFFLSLGPGHDGLRLALLTLAVLPCAPLVPAIVSFAGDPPEWSLFTFLGFSLLSLVVVVALTTALSHLGHDSGSPSEVAASLARYLGAVYGPMVLGVMIRSRFPRCVPIATRILRPVSGGALLGAIAIFAYMHRSEFTETTLSDVSLMVLFELFCVAVAIPLGIRFGGPLLTRVVTSGFRNFALAIAFSAMVLHRNDVSAYIVVFSVVTIAVCVVVCWIAMWLRPESFMPLQFPGQTPSALRDRRY